MEFLCQKIMSASFNEQLQVIMIAQNKLFISVLPRINWVFFGSISDVLHENTLSIGDKL